MKQPHVIVATRSHDLAFGLSTFQDLAVSGLAVPVPADVLERLRPSFDVVVTDADYFDLILAARQKGYAVIAIDTEQLPAGGERRMSQAYADGADDFLTRPVGLSELRSRIRAIVRRREGLPVPAAEAAASYGPLAIGDQSRILSWEREHLDLGPLATQIVRALLRAHGDVVPRAILARPRSDAVDRSNSLSVTIHELRQRFATRKVPATIKHEEGGYRLVLTD